MLKVKDIAEKYKVGESTVYKWVTEGLPKYKIGRSTRFDPDEVEIWIKTVKGEKHGTSL